MSIVFEGKRFKCDYQDCATTCDTSSQHCAPPISDGWMTIDRYAYNPGIQTQFLPKHYCPEHSPIIDNLLSGIWSDDIAKGKS